MLVLQEDQLVFCYSNCTNDSKNIEGKGAVMLCFILKSHVCNHSHWTCGVAEELFCHR